jgi:hypothetical protein
MQLFDRGFPLLLGNHQTATEPLRPLHVHKYAMTMVEIRCVALFISASLSVCLIAEKRASGSTGRWTTKSVWT